MADLLNPSDWAEFRSAIKDVTDTFAKNPVSITVNTKVYDEWNESKSGNTEGVDYSALGLLVFKSTQSNGAVNTKNGNHDLYDGYALFNREDLQIIGLIDSSNMPIIVADRDDINALGKKYRVKSVVPVGPTEDNYALIKLWIKDLYKENK